MAFQPTRSIGQQGKAGGMAFRETVFAETLDLAEDLLGELGPVATLGHAVDEPVPESADGAGPLEGRHGAAQLVGLTGTEARAEHGDLQDRKSNSLNSRH